MTYLAVKKGSEDFRYVLAHDLERMADRYLWHYVKYGQVGYAARTLNSNVSYHDLKYPVCCAKINLVHYAVRAAYPTFFNLHFSVPLMSHFRRAYVPGGSFFFTAGRE